MQKAYLLNRDDQELIVPLEQMTDEEIGAEIARLESEADGHLRHAQALEGKRRERFGA